MPEKNNYILLTFDVEEFDISLDYKFTIAPQQQMEVGSRGLNALLPILNSTNTECTLFTTANFALHHQQVMQQLSARHEIGSHTFYHGTFKEDDLAASKQALENICGKKVTGLRMPRMRPVNMEAVKAAGYFYDSSINPTWLPGRYNYTHLPRNIYNEKAVWRLPASVTPGLRIPLFWLSFKNFPYAVFKKLALHTLHKDGYLNLYFHPWEFTDINGFNLPAYVKKDCGQPLLDKLQRLIDDLKKEGECISIERYLQLVPPST